MPKYDAIKALHIYKRASQQVYNNALLSFRSILFVIQFELFLVLSGLPNGSYELNWLSF